MAYKLIKCEIKDRIMIITLNRPDRMNAYTDEMRDEIIAALDEADANPEARAVIITGAGKAFCAGKDLSEKNGDTFNNKATSIENHRDGGGLIALRLYEMKKPVIAAVNGSAVGVGITMTFPTDVCIIAENAKLGIVFARRGVVLDACAGWFLPRLVGMKKALEWSMSGKLFTAREALEAGLANYVVPAEEVLPKAISVAKEIIDNAAPVSVAMVRQLLWRMNAADHPMASHRIESKLFHWLGQQADVKEGIRAFKEKRSPNYSMDPGKDLPPFYPWWEDPPFKAQ